jgi:hypothetical protein
MGALDLALALYRAPDQRFALHELELPPDVGIVMQLASAPRPLLTETAAAIGENEATVVEAARFYLQQMLFQPDADAYRVLGLRRDVAQERIREHFHWLQRWLHPDRRGEDWESLFTSRVNWAWGQLRNDAARAAYDGTLRDGHDPHAQGLAPEGGMLVPDWHSAVVVPERSQFKRVAFVAAVCVLAGGIYWLVSHEESLSQEDLSASLVVENPAAGPDAGGFVDSASIRPRVDTADFRQAVVTTFAMPRASAMNPSLEIEPGSDATNSTPTRAETTRSPQTIALQAKVPAPPAHVEKTPASLAADDSTGVSSHDQAPAPPSAVSAQIADKPAEVAQVPALGPAASPPQQDPDVLARVDLARARVKELSTFFGDTRERSPPVWNDANGEASAETQRAALHERTKLGNRGTFAVQSPSWRLSDRAASLSADYELRNGRALQESGRLSLGMIWRDKMWLVTHVELEPEPVQ